MSVLVKRTVFQTECLDIVGIPSQVEVDALDEKVVAIFEKLGCNIPTERMKVDTGLVKRTPQSLSSFREGKTASRFGISREICKKIKMEDISLPGQNKLFINKSLCPYYKVIWAKSKKLQFWRNS